MVDDVVYYDDGAVDLEELLDVKPKHVAEPPPPAPRVVGGGFNIAGMAYVEDDVAWPKVVAPKKAKRKGEAAVRVLPYPNIAADDAAVAREKQAAEIKYMKTSTQATPKATPSPKEQDDPSTRVSYFGAKWPTSVADEWTYLKHVGWVNHKRESKGIERCLASCVATSEVYTKEALLQTIQGTYITPAAAKSLSWIQCHFSGRHMPPEDAIEAHNSPDTKVKVSRFLQEHNGNAVLRCDYYKLPWVGNLIRTVRDSENYKQVSQWAMDNTKVFGVCRHCSNLFEIAMVPLREETNDRRCHRCYLRSIRGQIILVHNAKDYPKPICSSVTRLGHKVGKDGLVYATNEKAKVESVRLFGVEVETEIHLKGAQRDKLDRISLAINVREALTPRFTLIKEDGTLTMNGKYSDPDGTGSTYAGFEIVTAPADLAYHREAWPRLEEAEGYKHLRAWDTETCGLHVHVSRAALTNLQIGRILNLTNHPRMQNLIHKLAGRGSDKYCRFLQKEYRDVLHPERVISPDEQERYNRSRRVAVNVSNAATVEFRVFRGTVNPKHIIRDIEVVDSICDYCYPGAVSLADLVSPKRYIHFIDVNRKKWPYLAGWLAFHNLIKTKVAGKGAALDKITLKAESVVEPEIRVKTAKVDKSVKDAEDVF